MFWLTYPKKEDEQKKWPLTEWIAWWNKNKIRGLLFTYVFEWTLKRPPIYLCYMILRNFLHIDRNRKEHMSMNENMTLFSTSPALFFAQDTLNILVYLAFGFMLNQSNHSLGIKWFLFLLIWYHFSNTNDFSNTVCSCIFLLYV